MNHLKTFSSFNESWKSVVAAGMLLLSTACDDVHIKSKGAEYSKPIDNYKGSGVIKKISKIPMSLNQCQYYITVIDTSGNEVSIEKIARNPFPDDETSGSWFVSDLKEGSKVNVICNGSDCKVYLIK